MASQYLTGKTRSDHDLLGDKQIPHEYYYGIPTRRAIENFDISGVKLSFYPLLVDALAMVKMAAAKANHKLGLLADDTADAMVQACHESLNGKYHNYFAVDISRRGRDFYQHERQRGDRQQSLADPRSRKRRLSALPNKGPKRSGPLTEPEHYRSVSAANLRFADNHIRGEQSGYLREAHRAEIARYFANASLL